jgi:hypothetical protein
VRRPVRGEHEGPREDAAAHEQAAGLEETFEKIKPYLDTRKTVVGMIFAQGLVHVLAQRIFGSDVRFFALRNIPWLCRATKHGEEAVIVGGKTSIDVITMNLEKDFIKKELEPLFVVQKTGKWEPVIELLPDFCPVVFNPANQIIHPAAYWGLFRNWHGAPMAAWEDTKEWLYRGMDEVLGRCWRCSTRSFSSSRMPTTRQQEPRAART